MCQSHILLIVLTEVFDTEISSVLVPSSRLSPPLTDFNKIRSFFLSFEGTIWLVCPFTVVKRHTANLNLISQIKNKKRRIWEGGWKKGKGDFFLFLLISYLWIYLDAGECCCTNFKHYLILQTSLLMLLRSEAHSTALAKRRWQRVHMCMSVRFQRGSRKSSVWARSDTSEQPKRPR